MIESKVLAWNSKITTHARKGLIQRALSCFLQMIRAGVEPDRATFSAAIAASTHSDALNLGPSLHCSALKKGFNAHLFVSSVLVTMYSKRGRVALARQLFDEMPVRDSVSWTSMISGYSQNGFDLEALCLFREMVKGFEGWSLFVSASGAAGTTLSATLSSVLTACAGLECCKIGKSVHGFAVRMRFDSDVFVSGASVDMYSKCGRLDMARRVFDLMRTRDLVVWNAMINGYAHNGYEGEAFECFHRLQNEGFVANETSYCCVLKASSEMMDSSYGRYCHAKILKSGFLLDVFVGTALVDLYSKLLQMEDAKRAFVEMKTRNLISFNALITGYGLVAGHEEAMKAYMELQAQGFKPDPFTFMGLLSCFTFKDSISEGDQVHSHLIMFGLNTDVFVGNSLIKFYSKCGLMDCALKAFKSIHAPNAITWAGIISGFAQNGDGERALSFFCKMQKKTEWPKRMDEFNSSSALKAITSCNSLYSGRHLHAHVLKGGLQHMFVVGSALIDMYSKCGNIVDGQKVFSEMPVKNVVCWNSMITGYAHNGFCSEALLLFQEMESLGILPTMVTFTGVLFACSCAGLVDEGRDYYKSMVNAYRIPMSVEHCTCMVDLFGRAGYLTEAETFILNSPYSQETDIWGRLLAACGLHKNFDVGSRAELVIAAL